MGTLITPYFYRDGDMMHGDNNVGGIHLLVLGVPGVHTFFCGAPKCPLNNQFNIL